jgi:lactoylglutathione lyase
MPYDIEKLTPNLIVSNVEQSLAFYCDVLGFAKTDNVPEESPYVFAIVESGPVKIFFNARGPAVEEYPSLANMPIGGTLTLYMEVSSVAKIYDDLKARVKVTMPLEKKFYGVTEFAFEDPDGYVITFAERTT